MPPLTIEETITREGGLLTRFLRDDLKLSLEEAYGAASAYPYGARSGLIAGYFLGRGVVPSDAVFIRDRWLKEFRRIYHMEVS